jgi:archaellum biogenesis ATPase FlaH
VMLEKMILEILNNFKGMKRDLDKYIVIDSLSALMIYNDPEIIREFMTLVMNRSRSENIHVVSILVEEEMDSSKLIQLNDKIIVLRDSFID